MLHGRWTMQNALSVSIGLCPNINGDNKVETILKRPGGKPECGTHVLVQSLEQYGCRQIELVRVTYSGCRLTLSADKIMRDIRFQSQPMKEWFPASSSAFSSLFFIYRVPYSTYKELRSECTRVKSTFMQRDLSLVIVSLFTMLFFTETVGIPYGSRIIFSVRDLLLVRSYKSLR